MNIDTLLKHLIQGKHLSREESFLLFSNFSTLPAEQQASVLTLIRAKKESMEEVLGAMDYFLPQATPINTNFDVIDMVGTGGDGKNTFNITTAASLVVAACGAYVAKHGARASTSKAGSMDTIECLGIPTASDAPTIDVLLKQHHYAYLLASAFNTSFASLAPLRKKLPFPTLFNTLGPLLNPLKPKRRIIGVYRRDLIAVCAQICVEQQVTHALVVHAEDGMDELSIATPSYVAEIKNGRIEHYILDPRDLGLHLAPIESIHGGLAQNNAQMIQGVLSHAIHGAPRDVVALNAAAGLYVAGIARDFVQGLNMAQHALSKTINIPQEYA